MGANNSTRRVSFESDENENVTVVKGIRLSENVINRMREPVTPPKRQQAPSPPPSKAPPLTPLLRPVPPLLEPITSLPPLSPLVELAPPAPPPSAPFVTEPVATPPAPPPQPPQEKVPVEPVSPAPAPEPVVVPESSPAPPPPPPPPPVVDEEALRKEISDELHKSFAQERAKAEQELQAWLEKEKARVAKQASTDAQSLVQNEVSKILSVERAFAQENLQQAVIRERIATEDGKLRAQLFDKYMSDPSFGTAIKSKGKRKNNRTEEIGINEVLWKGTVASAEREREFDGAIGKLKHYSGNKVQKAVNGRKTGWERERREKRRCSEGEARNNDLEKAIFPNNVRNCKVNNRT
ncbi:hypothetical protein JOB18_009483 [Solea senegalensis]|uniref:Uncharacterized protein n=1 Tax=Solea senegalensis TaxID=28829 RepID=A0AAV6S839_SOLSE|nr:hypothetical protein JOB18_009483 [Solea senegalensis]